ncbi:MAG: lysylphosphatidylglycerol synthase domain-containing protein, partial [Candidatus Bathyarchaeia archaeon]
MKFSRKISIQISAVTGALAILIWYLSISGLLQPLLMADIRFLALAMLAYFAINLVFAFRIKRVLGKQGYSVGYWKTVFAQYGGMLASDVTPGKAGYLIMPILLKGHGVPVPTGLSCILGIQSVEFFVKVFGSMLAIIFILIQFQLEASV